MLRVYPATKMKNAQMIRALAEVRRVPVFLCARWLRHAEIETPDDAANAVRFWPENVDDVRASDLLFVFAEVADHLKGALVEAGIAIASGVPVIVVGNHPDYGTWRHHPGVARTESIATLVTVIEEIDRRGLETFWCADRRRWIKETEVLLVKSPADFSRT